MSVDSDCNGSLSSRKSKSDIFPLLGLLSSVFLSNRLFRGSRVSRVSLNVLKWLK